MLKLAVTCAALAGALLVAACQQERAQPVHPTLSAVSGDAAIAITPAGARVDQRLDISISRLPPKTLIAVTAATEAPDGLWWRSQASFVSDAQGRLDLGAQAPVSGSYRAVDAMGLFWSMSPDREPKGAERAYFDTPNPEKPNETRIGVWEGTRLLATHLAIAVEATAPKGTPRKN